MIRLGIIIIVAGIVMLFMPIPGAAIALAGLITIGLGCAPIYPSIIHSTPFNFGADNSQAVTDGICLCGNNIYATIIRTYCPVY